MRGGLTPQPTEASLRIVLAGSSPVVFGIARASGAWHGVCVGLAPGSTRWIRPQAKTVCDQSAPKCTKVLVDKGGVFADYFQFKDCPAGSTLVATSVDSPAYNSQPKTAVLIITMAQEKAGERDG